MSGIERKARVVAILMALTIIAAAVTGATKRSEFLGLTLFLFAGMVAIIFLWNPKEN
jgi:hypothetical protein